MTGPAAAAGACPVCGKPLPVRPGRRGRPPAWCGKTCRQTAYRARRAAERAAEHAAWLRGRLAAAMDELREAEGAVATANGRALNAMNEHDARPGADPADHLTGDGPRWEMPLHDAARQLAAAAARVAQLAADHDRALREHRMAVRVFRRPPAELVDGDEKPGDSVATTTAAAAATKTPDPAPVVHDVDELFEAAEDVLTAAINGSMPPELSALLDADLTRLEKAWQDATGDDPAPLAAAAATLAAHLPAASAGEVPHAMYRLSAAVRSDALGPIAAHMWRDTSRT